MPLHIVGISNNRVWTTTRISESNGFTPWIDVGASANAAADAAGSPRRLPANATLLDVGCAMVDDGNPTRLHVCVSFRVGPRVGLVHTVETSPGQFFEWGDAYGVAFSNARLDLDGSIACAGMGSQLHVCVKARSNTGQVSTPLAVWRSIRNPSAWSPVRIVSDTRDSILNVGCAAVPHTADPRTDLHVLYTTSDNGPMHNVVTSAGVSLGDARIIPLIPPPIPGIFNTANIFKMSASGYRGDLSVVASDATNMVLTGRQAATPSSWNAMIDLRSSIQPGFVEPLHWPACAHVGSNLHIIATSQGRIMHGIRTSSGAFRNPESSTTTLFGDVTCAAPPGPAGRAPAMFTVVSCAGHTAF